MSLTQLRLLVGAALALTFFSCSEAGEVGVCYGMMGSNLMQPPAVVKLLKNNSINSVFLFDADAVALRALANTGIKVVVSLPNKNLVDAAGNMWYALRWVRRNVMAYPNTLIGSVAVGNEVFHQQPQLTPQLLPAMKNIQAALARLGLADAVKVITPIALDALKVPSFPPSLGEFRDDLAQSVMSPMIDFLEQTCSYLSFNIYPYFGYKYHPDQVDLDFALFRATKYDPGTGLTCHSLFDAMVDAVFHAVEKLNNSREHSRGRMLWDHKRKIVIPEVSWPTKGSIGNVTYVSKKSVTVASIRNAQTYTSNLIRRVLTGGGTPYNQDADISVYIFSLFNENLKPGDENERNFGLFYPNGRPVYKLDFVHPGPSPAAPGGASPSWCTANATAGDKRLKDATDYACSHGANCSAIQAGGRCFDPNTMVVHASYAFNNYYQRNGQSGESCDFGGCGSVVHQQPKFGNCAL